MSSIFVNSPETGCLVVVDEDALVGRRRLNCAHGMAHALFDRQRHGRRRTEPMNDRWSGTRPAFRCSQASALSSIRDQRSSGAGVLAGTGEPKETVTGNGSRSGHFVTKRPCLKLKMLPHMRSRCTGTMGTSWNTRRRSIRTPPT